jgi:hypothetical protein
LVQKVSHVKNHPSTLSRPASEGKEGEEKKEIAKVASPQNFNYCSIYRNHKAGEEEEGRGRRNKENFFNLPPNIFPCTL